MKNTVLEQALQLSEEILSNIELNEISLSNIALKTSRLARLLDDFENQLKQFLLRQFLCKSVLILKLVFHF